MWMEQYNFCGPSPRVFRRNYRLKSDYFFSGFLFSFRYHQMYDINLKCDLGVSAKIQVAQRAGCTHVYIPAQNNSTLSPAFLDECLINIVSVENVSQVVEEVLPTLMSLYKSK